MRCLIESGQQGCSPPYHREDCPANPEAKAEEEKPDLEVRKEWLRLSRLLYQNGDLALSTDERDGHRWLTDRYVLLDVTGSIAIREVADGAYKLVQSKGLVAREGAENYLDGGIVDYLELVETDAVWEPVIASQWSVAEHPGKAMLLACKGLPVLMGESTWTSLHRHYERPDVQYDVHSGRNLFRVCAPSYELSWVVAYVAGIRIPDGQEAVAQAIAGLTHSSTSD